MFLLALLFFWLNEHFLTILLSLYCLLLTAFHISSKPDPCLKPKPCPEPKSYSKQDPCSRKNSDPKWKFCPELIRGQINENICGQTKSKEDHTKNDTNICQPKDKESKTVNNNCKKNVQKKITVVKKDAEEDKCTRFTKGTRNTTCRSNEGQSLPQAIVDIFMKKCKTLSETDIRVIKNIVKECSSHQKKWSACKKKKKYLFVQIPVWWKRYNCVREMHQSLAKKDTGKSR